MQQVPTRNDNPDLWLPLEDSAYKSLAVQIQSEAKGISMETTGKFINSEDGHGPEFQLAA